MWSLCDHAYIRVTLRDFLEILSLFCADNYCCIFYMIHMLIDLLYYLHHIRYPKNNSMIDFCAQQKGRQLIVFSTAASLTKMVNNKSNHDFFDLSLYPATLCFLKVMKPRRQDYNFFKLIPSTPFCMSSFLIFLILWTHSIFQ